MKFRNLNRFIVRADRDGYTYIIACVINNLIQGWTTCYDHEYTVMTGRDKYNYNWSIYCDNYKLITILIPIKGILTIKWRNKFSKLSTNKKVFRNNEIQLKQYKCKIEHMKVYKITTYKQSAVDTVCYYKHCIHSRNIIYKKEYTYFDHLRHVNILYMISRETAI